MKYSLFGNFIKSQGLTSVFSFVRGIHRSAPALSNQKIAIIGSGPKALLIKKNLLELNVPSSIYQFSSEQDHQDLVHEPFHISIYKQILRALDPSSVFLNQNCKPELLFNTVDRLMDEKLGLKRIFSDVSTMSHDTGKIDIHLKGQELSSHIKLAPKTYKDFDSIFTSNGNIATPAQPKILFRKYK